MALEVRLPPADRFVSAPSRPEKSGSRFRLSLAFRGLLAGGLGALMMLVCGEVAPGLLPLRVTLEARGDQLAVTTEGAEHIIPRDDLPWDHLQFEQPGPEDHEVQIDGSETVGRGDREPEYIRALATSPLYA